MKIIHFCFAVVLMLMVLTGCASDNVPSTYISITSSEAKELMDNENGYVILDVRTEKEFAEGHIPGAILIPDYDIEEYAEEKLPDKKQLILVYCRSGRRSKNAAAKLAEMGYSNVKEFGGIIDWSYGTTKES